MNTTELHDLFRVEIADVEEPTLIASASIYAYIDAAQKQFCRLTEGIEDGRSFILSITPGVEWYAIDKKILKLRKAYDMATNSAVEIINQEQVTQHGVGFGNRYGSRGVSGLGCRVLVAGAQKNQLRVLPVPAVDSVSDLGKIQLEVFRLPRTVEKGDDLEIDEQHHMPLLMWVKHLAYDNHDTEIFDRRKSDDYEIRFERYCMRAKSEQSRARRQVGSVAYGGL